MPENEGSQEKLSRKEQLTQEISELRAELGRVYKAYFGDKGVVVPGSEQIADERVGSLEESIKTAEKDLEELGN
jgi:hypothetical protein